VSQQRPLNPIEVKANFSKAMTEASASLETLWAFFNQDRMKIVNENEVLKAEIQAKNAEISRLKNPPQIGKGPKTAEARKVKPDDAVTPKK